MKKTVTYNAVELIEKIKAGDKKSFAMLYDMYSKALYGIIFKIVNDGETAGDVLQDAFIKIWKKIDTYDQNKGTVFTWMLNVARNTAIDSLRLKQNKPETHSLESKSVEIRNMDSSSKNMDTIDMMKNLQILKPEHQEIIDLVYFQGMTQDEIAMKTNIPLGTVKTRVRSALIALREIYN